VAIGAAVAAPLAWAIDKRFDNEGSSSGDYVALVIEGGRWRRSARRLGHLSMTAILGGFYRAETITRR
jgi:hypothetical protein